MCPDGHMTHQIGVP